MREEGKWSGRREEKKEKEKEKEEKEEEVGTKLLE